VRPPSLLTALGQQRPAAAARAAARGGAGLMRVQLWSAQAY
jgi:hypothetical protein